MLKIVLIGGDGIGPEVTAIAKHLLLAYQNEGFELELTEVAACADRYLQHGVILTPDEWQQIATADAIVLGAFGDRRVPRNEHAAGILMRIRKELDLFANVRPCLALSDSLVPLVGKNASDLRFWVFRENTEGAYSGIGDTHRLGMIDEMAVETDVTTRRAVERIVVEAFSFAASRGLPSVCMADKSNAQPHVGGVWQRAFAEIAPKFPQVTAFHLYADALCDRLVREPEKFSVIVTSNLIGDLISDLGASLSGGLGLAPSINRGLSGPVLVEPVHGSAPDIAGKGIANPMASLRCIGQLWEHFGREYGRIEGVITAMVLSGECTPDIGGTMTTREVWEAFLGRWSAG